MIPNFYLLPSPGSPILSTKNMVPLFCHARSLICSAITPCACARQAGVGGGQLSRASPSYANEELLQSSHCLCHNLSDLSTSWTQNCQIWLSRYLSKLPLSATNTSNVTRESLQYAFTIRYPNRSMYSLGKYCRNVKLLL